MEWSDIGGAVAKFAPLLGSVVGGPAGGAIGSVIASALGVDNEPDAVLKAIQTDPNAALKLKQAELDNKAKLEEILFKTAKAEIADKQNARKENKHSLMPAILSVGLTVAIAGIVYMLFYVNVPAGSKDVLFMLLGVVVKEWGGAMQYWFGTTRSSAEKSRASVK